MQIPSKVYSIPPPPTLELVFGTTTPTLPAPLCSPLILVPLFCISFTLLKATAALSFLVARLVSLFLSLETPTPRNATLHSHFGSVVPILWSTFCPPGLHPNC